MVITVGFTENSQVPFIDVIHFRLTYMVSDNYVTRSHERPVD